LNPDFKTRFSTKAEIYHQYRWDYPPEAVEKLFEIVAPADETVIADIGAGTGIFTRHLLGLAREVYAVEPNPEMRACAERHLSAHPSFRSVAGSAEATSLPDHSVDLITIVQALHWCDAEATVREFRRIIKPGGWLAIIWNSSTDPELGNALNELRSEAYGWDTSPINRPRCQPYVYYFGHEDYQSHYFCVSTAQTWDQFFGGICSDSHAPLADHPAYADFEAATRAIFNNFRVGEMLPSSYQTELTIGQLAVTMFL